MSWCMDCKSDPCACDMFPSEAQENARRESLKAMLDALRPHLTAWAQNHLEALLNDLGPFLAQRPPIFPVSETARVEQAMAAVKTLWAEAHVPPDGLTPIVYDAGQDRRLFEANGWDWDQRGKMGDGFTAGRIKVQAILDKACAIVAWTVFDGTGWLSRNTGGPITFCMGREFAERCPTLEAAKALLDEYLNQPINPYLWVREGDKP